MAPRCWACPHLMASTSWRLGDGVCPGATGTAEDKRSPLPQLDFFLGLHDLQITLSGLACLLTHLSMPQFPR